MNYTITISDYNAGTFVCTTTTGTTDVTYVVCDNTLTN